MADAAACFGLRGDGATALPIVSMSDFSLCRLSRVVEAGWQRLVIDSRCYLDAGEGGLLLFAVAFSGEGDEAIDELFVGYAGRLPEFGVHANAGEAGHGVDFVEVDAGGFGFSVLSGFDGWLHEEVDAGEASTVAGAEGGEGHFADLPGLGFGELGGDDGDACVGVVLGVVVVELGAGDDFSYDGGNGGVVAEDGYFEFAGLGSGAADALFDDELAVVAGGEVHRGGEFAAVVDFADAYGRA